MCLNGHHVTCRRTGSFLLVLFLFITSCERENMDPDQGHFLSQPIRPDHFPPAHYVFGNNVYSKKGFELGRKLFFDPILSLDSTISCESCHHQKDAFADGGRAFSVGINGQTSDRNSPPVFNMAWNRSFMWDGGINHIEIMPFAPIIHPKEMGEDLTNVVRKLNAHGEYPSLFQRVFGQGPITDQQMFWALAQYLGNLVSANSRYDRHVQGELSLTSSEMAGLGVFRQHCASCHQEPLFTDQGFHNNGLDAVFIDEGRFRITQDPADLGTFKTPTLRNIALTAPYMHDGRFASLADVLEHYTQGIQASATLSSELQPHVGGIFLSASEQLQLTDFLHALTDSDFVNNDELSE